MKTLTKPTTNVKKVSELKNKELNSVSKMLSNTIKDIEFSKLLDRLTTFKEGDSWSMVFRPCDHHLLCEKDSNDRNKTKKLEPHQADLKKSRELIGNLSVINIVIENGKFYVADGGNRLRAFKNKTILACVSKGNFSDTFTYMNIYKKVLTSTQNISHCSKEGAYQKDYKILMSILDKNKQTKKDTKKKNQIQPCLITALLGGMGVIKDIDRQYVTNLVSAKKFKTNTKLTQRTETIIQQIYELQNVGLPVGIGANEGMVFLMNELGAEYNHKQMLVRLKKAEKMAIIRSPKANANILRDIHDNTVNGQINYYLCPITN